MNRVLSSGIAIRIWTITGVRAHLDPNDRGRFLRSGFGEFNGYRNLFKR